MIGTPWRAVHRSSTIARRSAAGSKDSLHRSDRSAWQVALRHDDTGAVRPDREVAEHESEAVEQGRRVEQDVSIGDTHVLADVDAIVQDIALVISLGWT